MPSTDDHEWGDSNPMGGWALEGLEAELARELERYAPPVTFQTYDVFSSEVEVTSEPLMGTATETILPANGLLLMYGDGGAGKTTLSVDAAAHLGSGSDWLGIEIGRQMRVTLIENEGPRGKFRQMLAEKSESWVGDPFTKNVTVLEEPWTQFTLRQEEHRMALAQHVQDNEVDVVFMGPLVTLGMVGGGTPDEVSAFEVLVSQTRASCSRPFALWVVHHENKAGDVSGAWERVPDTLCHVQARGNGHTTLIWRKARWSSENHGKSVDLTWEPGRSFALVEEVERDPYAEMLSAFVQDDEWRTAKEAGKLIHLTEAEAKKVLGELTRRGDMRFEKGPHGRHATAQCWRLEGARSSHAHLSAPSEKHDPESEVRGCAPPVRGAAPRSAPAPSSEGARNGDSAPPSSTDDDFPF